jgi:hypothetical protein
MYTPAVIVCYRFTMSAGGCAIVLTAVAIEAENVMDVSARVAVCLIAAA